MSRAVQLLLAGVMSLAGCVTAQVPPVEPSAMIPAKLNAILPAGTSLYVDRVRLESAASEGKAPFDEVAGQFPLTQAEGLTNFRESIRLVMVSMGAKSTAAPEEANYVFRTSILGGMAIPFMEAYSVLFVHYQLEDRKTGQIVWMKNVYSQAKMEKHVPITPSETPDSAYARVATANLRQVAMALSAWFASGVEQVNKGE